MFSFPSASYDILIIGAGFSGTSLALQVLKAKPHLRVLLIEKSSQFGVGVAYRTGHAEHYLNVPASSLALSPDEPLAFVNYLAQQHPELSLPAESFVSRQIFGKFLQSQLQEANRRFHNFHLLQDEVIHVSENSQRISTIQTRDGLFFTAHQVIFAWGHFAPSHPLPNHPIALTNAWDFQQIPLHTRFQRLLIIGSGLTAFDVLSTLHQQNYLGEIHVTSRRGHLPHFHVKTDAWKLFITASDFPLSLRQVVQRVRQQIKHAASLGVHWQAVVDSLRPITQQIWQQWTLKDRARFLQRLQSTWEQARHRSTPALQQVLTALQKQFFLHRGHLQNIQALPEGGYQVKIQSADHSLQNLEVDQIINATGPTLNAQRIQNPLFQQLLQNGDLIADPLALGAHMSLTRSHWHLLGPLQRGQYFEITAVAELQLEAQRLSQHLIRQFPN